MKVQSTVRCHCPDCNGKEYSIEFTVNRNGRIHCEPVPLYDDLHPCLVEIKTMVEGKRMFPPDRHGGRWFDTAEIREAVRRALFTLDDHHKIEIETREDTKRIVIIIRNQGYSILYQISQSRLSLSREQYWLEILNKMHQCGADTAEIIRELSKVALEYIDTATISDTAQAAFKAMILDPTTKPIAVETLQEITRGHPTHLLTEHGLDIAWEIAIESEQTTINPNKPTHPFW